MDFIKGKWEVRAKRYMDDDITKDKYYELYELVDGCRFMSNVRSPERFIYLNDKNEWHCCTEKCALVDNMDFKNGKFEAIKIFGFIPSTKCEPKKKSNKELFGI